MCWRSRADTCRTPPAPERSTNVIGLSEVVRIAVANVDQCDALERRVSAGAERACDPFSGVRDAHGP